MKQGYIPESPEATTPSNPANGYRKTYWKPDGNLYMLQSDGTETLVWPTPYFERVVGQWALQNNEVNGWGVIGSADNTNSQDFGNYTNYQTLNAATMGGMRFPVDVRFVEMDLLWRNTTGTMDWKWIIYRHTKTAGTAVETTEMIYDGPLRSNANVAIVSQTILTSDDLIDPVIPAGDFFLLAAGTPVQAANENVQVYDGYAIFEPVLGA